MSFSASSASLQARHSMIESQIRDERSRPLPNEMIIASLKKEKLLIKDVLGRK